MSDAVETIEHKGHTIEIFHDECDWSPRENDNMCIFHIAHRNYAFGEHQWMSRQEVDDAQREAEAIGDICVPLYMYDHSGITISLTPFTCPFDSGQVGFVQIKKDEIISNFGKKNWTKNLRIKALEVAAMEVKELDSYLTGEVYGYIIDRDGLEQEGSCWGFIGDIKYCIDEAKGEVDAIIQHSQRVKTSAL